MKCKYSEKQLWAFVSRADTHDRVRIADEFLTNLSGLDVELYNELMDALAYISRELYHQDFA